MYYGFYYDWTYILVLIGVVLSLFASSQVKGTFAKYSKIRSYSGMTGREAAEQILRRNGIYDVQVTHIAGNLTDHYDPRNKTLALSDPVYNFEGYAPLSIRGALVPVVNFGSMISWPLIIIGLFMNGQMSSFLIDIGILLFMVAVAFHLITLPVEINASRRAVKVLGNSGMLREDEVGGVKKVLRAAAMTYVASAAAMILQLLRLLILINGRRRND